MPDCIICLQVMPLRSPGDGSMVHVQVHLCSNAHAIQIDELASKVTHAELKFIYLDR